MAAVTMKQLLEAGVHFGHQTRRWNPKMRPFIFGERNGIHIIDLRQTVDQIADATKYVTDLTSNGGTVLFVGTKKQAQTAVAEHATRSSMPFVNYRWLGGMLTNFQTIQKRIFYMRELRRLEASGEINALPKKERLKLRRELAKLEQNLGGVVDLQKTPDAVFIVDVNTEATAVKEADRLGIPIIALVDTNSDPDPVDFVIPGNDDAIRAADLIAGAIAKAIMPGDDPGGIIVTILIGIVGAFLGGFLGNMITGSTTVGVITNASGVASFDVPLPEAPVTAGHFITATATDANGNTVALADMLAKRHRDPLLNRF